jgi:hypothetical protein
MSLTKANRVHGVRELRAKTPQRLAAKLHGHPALAITFIMTPRAVILTALLSLAPAPAIAASIGTFAWVHDIAFPDLSTFDVFNSSGSVFEGVVVDLFAPGAVVLQSVPIDNVPDGESRQSIDPLLPDVIERVRLSLMFGSQTIGVDLLASSLVDDTEGTFKTAAVDILAPEPSAPVPEPATLILLGSGLAALGWRRRTKATRSRTQ